MAHLDAGARRGILGGGLFFRAARAKGAGCTGRNRERGGRRRFDSELDGARMGLESAVVEAATRRMGCTRCADACGAFRETGPDRATRTGKSVRRPLAVAHVQLATAAGYA